MNSTDPRPKSVVPSRQEYEDALALVNGTRSAADFDEPYDASDIATARVWIAEYEAAQARTLALRDELAERAIAAAAWDDAEQCETGDGFFIYRPADDGEGVVYVGIGASDGSYQIAPMDADRLCAVAALLLAEAQHLTK